ncbi:Any1p ASCRUDRAFT_33460 [Ascoidea rubescens DSM 1968]|uniref:PQ-loop-domain-containing protein n=1 Tax=Ascoidea rubescens DSM 1968 TaxID=1344418 RepID=A0A1D2VK41_9ASCO|nr:hypothetical protein ASCRUDRAFT_33460 [Ascoidea rubescens DSM 1968]ODV61980.1 hypothetical protein ASCRUDRAFT_33460 [Ascoidea rubescens DSM 1968]
MKNELDIPQPPDQTNPIPVQDPVAPKSAFSSLPLYYYMIPEWLTFQAIVNNIMAFTPIFSYGSTILSIIKQDSSIGFSIDICCTMLVASILRINYYFIESFEITLLRQSCSMIFIQCILLYVSLYYKLNKDVKIITLHNHNSIYHQKYLYTNSNDSNEFLNYLPMIINFFKKSFEFSYLCLIIIFQNFINFFDPYYKRSFQFWQWEAEYKYWLFIIQFTIIISFSTFLFKDSIFYSNFIGITNLLIESLLPLPQILLLNRLKSVKGFKSILLFSWYCGDLVKTSYLLFGTKKINSFFIFFAFFQTTLDVIIGFQFIYYKFFYNTDNDSFIQNQSFTQILRNRNRNRNRNNSLTTNINNTIQMINLELTEKKITPRPSLNLS